MTQTGPSCGRLSLVSAFLLFAVTATASAQVHDSASGKVWKMTQEQASAFAKLALRGIEKEYPNKTGHVMNGEADIVGPKQLHPAFYGSFDWHSTVHGHWMLVRLLRTVPNLPEEKQIRDVLSRHFTAENLKAEADYFNRPNTQSFERPYGWAWLLKLAEELHDWDDPQGGGCYCLKPNWPG